MGIIRIFAFSALVGVAAVLPLAAEDYTLNTPVTGPVVVGPSTGASNDNSLTITASGSAPEVDVGVSDSGDASRNTSTGTGGTIQQALRVGITYNGNANDNLVNQQGGASG